MDQQRGRAAATPTTTKHAPPPPLPPEQAAEPEPVVTGCLHEAGFHITGPHRQGGVAIARSIHDARQRLADMLIFCDPTAAAVADITVFTRAGASSPGTAAPSPSCSPTSTPAPRPHRPRPPPVGLTTPRIADGR